MKEGNPASGHAGAVRGAAAEPPVWASAEDRKQSEKTEQTVVIEINFILLL
jgi:hypothetical protein